MPLHLHPYYREIFGYAPSACPSASAIYPELVSLPLYPDLTAKEVERVCNTLKQIIAASHTTVRGAELQTAAEVQV